MLSKYLKSVVLTTSLISCAPFAFAAENGGSAYPDGTESFFAGAMPSPGTYLVSYNQFYSADKFKNDHLVFDDFKLDTFATVARGVYVSDKTFLGATWGMHAFLVYANADITLGGGQDEKTALGDVIIDPFLLGWHKGNWHVATGVDFYIPVGSYNKNRLANIGRNYYTIQPIISTTYLNQQGIEVSTKWMYDINFENKDTNYESGNALHVDYIVVKHMGPLAVGLGGYVHRQLEGDSGEGAILGDFKAKAASIGPQVRYQFPKGIAVAAKYQKEFDVENRPEGQKFALDLTIPF
ncbi:MAG: SphA family protein [Acinetobacter sp.]